MVRSRQLNARDTNQRALTIGLIAADEDSAARIRHVLADCGVTVGFDITPHGLENGPLSTGIDVLVLTGSLRPSSDSLLSRVRHRHPEKPIVACTQPAEASHLRWAIANGVDGVVLDPRLEETLEATLRAVHAGQLVFPRALQRRAETMELTNREKQALSLMIMGFTNRQIAEKLYLSESTVKSHLNSAFRKLGVRSRAEAAQLIADPDKGLGTGILAITAPGLTRGRRPKS
jgi:DNA-binding NarL/FixJ family response regulator